MVILTLEWEWNLFWYVLSGFLNRSRAIYKRTREDLGGFHLLKTPPSELKCQTPGINSTQKMYSRLTIWVWMVNSPVLDTENDGSIVLNEDKPPSLPLLQR